MRFTVVLASTWVLTSFVPLVSNAEQPQLEPGFVSIFNGQDLSGWEGREDCWRVVDGVIEGAPETGDETPSCWLVWRDGTLKNFHLKLKFRIRSGNSGVFYRASRVGRGYQSDVRSDATGTGKLYHGGGKLGAHAAVGQFVVNNPGGKGELAGEVANPKWLQQLPYYVPGEWAECEVVARGNHILHIVNGLPTVEFIDRDEQDAERRRRVDEGILGLQLHRGHYMQVQFRDIRLKQFSGSFRDALLLFNSRNLEGWSVPQNVGDHWRVGTSKTADDKTKKKPDAPEVLICDGSGRTPLVWTGSTPKAFVLRYQRFTGKDDPSADTPLRSAAGWENVEVTVCAGQTRMEVNGQRKTGPLPRQNGKIALPSDLAAEYRNVVLIPIQL